VFENNGIKLKLGTTLTEPIKRNKRFRQGCPISPTVFNVYTNQIITEWKEEEIKKIQILRNTDKNTIFADDQVTVADLEDALKNLCTYTRDSYLQI
jgi:hypothetical protein